MTNKQAIGIGDWIAYNPETGDLTWKRKSRNGKRQAGDVAGWLSSCKHIQVKVCGETYYAHRVAWLLYYGIWPKNHIDHINHNRADNRIANLREASWVENNRNARLRRDSSFGINGVSFLDRGNKWKSMIYTGGRSIFLGHHDSLLDACCARKTAELVHGFHPNHGTAICTAICRATGYEDA